MEDSENFCYFYNFSYVFLNLVTNCIENKYQKNTIVRSNNNSPYDKL